MPDRKSATFPRPTRSASAMLAGALFAAALPCTPTSATAQVTTNNSALDALGGTATAPKDDAATPRRHAVAPPGGSTGGSTGAHRAAMAAPAAAAPPAKSPPESTAQQKMAPLPPALVSPPPPVPVVAAPVVDVPLHPAPLPPAVHPDDAATGTVTPLPGKNGVRVVIAHGGETPNAAMIDAVRSKVAAPVLADPRDRVEIDAFGGADANDQSAPRRAALARGLAIRSILMHDGVVATRIYVRALGPTRPTHLASEDGEDTAALSPDRTDVLIVTEAAPIPAESTVTSAALPAAMGGAAATTQAATVPAAAEQNQGKERTR